MHKEIQDLKTKVDYLYNLLTADKTMDKKVIFSETKIETEEETRGTGDVPNDTQGIIEKITQENVKLKREIRDKDEEIADLLANAENNTTEDLIKDLIGKNDMMKLDYEELLKKYEELQRDNYHNKSTIADNEQVITDLQNKINLLSSRVNRFSNEKITSLENLKKGNRHLFKRGHFLFLIAVLKE